MDPHDELRQVFELAADTMSWARCFGATKVPDGSALRAVTELVRRYEEQRQELLSEQEKP